MSTERDPPRLFRGGEDVPPELSRALLAARGRRVGEAVIADVAARLPQGPPGSAGAGPEEDSGPSSGRDGDGAPDSAGSRSVDPASGPRSGAARASAAGPANKGQRPGDLTSGSRGAGSDDGAPPRMPPVWPGILVGAALGALVGAASLLVPTSSPAPPGPPAALAPPSAHSAFSSTGTGTETEADYLRRADDLIATAPAQALAMAEAHPQRYPDGKLAQEREVIAAFALAALGRKVEARARARLLVTLYPDSPHRRRLGELVPEPGAPEKSTGP